MQRSYRIEHCKLSYTQLVDVQKSIALKNIMSGRIKESEHDLMFGPTLIMDSIIEQMQKLA